MDRLNKIQIEQLKFLETSADESIIKNLIEIFQEQKRTLIAEMKDHLHQGRLNRLSEVAHKLKSSAGQLGFAEVEKISLKLETEGRRQTDFNFAEALQALEAECDCALAELIIYLDADVKLSKLSA